MVDKLFSSDDCYVLTNKEVRELYKDVYKYSLNQKGKIFSSFEEKK